MEIRKLIGNQLRSTTLSLIIGTLTFIATGTAFAEIDSDDALFDTAIPKQANLSNTTRLVPAAPTPNANGYILMDASTGKVITAKNANETMPPASLTKIMSLYVISQAIKSGQIRLDDQVRISKDASSADGSKMFLKEGELVSVKDLLQGIIVASGNDATYAMAEYIAGSENSFVDLMNQEARALGMMNSNFVDSTGMPNPDHYSTPLDMAILSSALIRNFPEYYHFYSQKWFTFNNIKQPNRNRLLWRYKYADGIKTGHTQEAGYCLAASAKNQDMRLISIIMGAPTDGARADGSERLLTYGFRFFKTYKLYSSGDKVSNTRIWQGKQDLLPLGIKQNIIVTVPRGQYDKLQITTTLEDPLLAPVKKGQRLGVLKIALADNQLAEVPLYALADMPKAGMLKRIKDSINLKFHNMFTSQDTTA